MHHTCIAMHLTKTCPVWPINPHARDDDEHLFIEYPIVPETNV